MKFLLFILAIAVSSNFMAMRFAVAADSCIDSKGASLPKIKKEISEIEAVLSQNLDPVNSPSQKPAACSSINLRTAQLHVMCTTSKGSIFERVSRDKFGESWKGPDGIIWSDSLGSGSQKDAVNICKNVGGNLPSKTDFERGEDNGFREVLPNMDLGLGFWSSWVRPSDFDVGDIFDSDDGGIISSSRKINFSVRCVGR